MNVLFLTLSRVYGINEHDIYQDLVREFLNAGHSIYVVTPSEKHNGLQTSILDSCGCKILRVRVGNQSNCSFIEKGISTITIGRDYQNAIKSYFKNIRFDLILYSTPPVTLISLVKKLKKKYSANTYLMLKDIFPQNAVDIGIMSGAGPIYFYFRMLEKKLYAISDHIGCMSPANVDYLLKHNKTDAKKINICANAITPAMVDIESCIDHKKAKKANGIPDDACVFVYGGNLGKPQGIDFMLRCIDAISNDSRVFLLIIGDGSEFGKLEKYVEDSGPSNIRLYKRLPRDEYFSLIKCADVGMVFLDHRFTIPNFPSRILPYMENYMPIACVTDDISDVGCIAEENGFGWKCSSDDVSSFVNMMEKVLISDLNVMGKKARKYLENNYSASECYESIVSALEDKE